MRKSRDELINDLVETLSRVRKERPDDYAVRLRKYIDMRDSGDGGPWRDGATTSLRELHYLGWQDEDFQTVLELLDETPVLSEEDRAERFAHERSFWRRLRRSLGK